MIEPNKELLSDPEIPTIEIFGVKWPVPKLAIAQLRIVGPILVARASGMTNITADTIDDMATLVFWALKRGHEDLTREDFDDMPMDLPGLIAGWHVVAQQAGIFRPTKNGAAVPLEPAAASSPTG